MNLTKSLTTLGYLFALTFATNGHCQVYYYSGPVSGYVDVCLTPSGTGSGAFRAYFGTLTETLYYNPIAGTIEEVGSVTVSPSSGTFNILSGPYHYPPESGSATVTVGTNGSFSFDRTTSLNGPVPLLNIPVTGYGIYNGQPFSGSWKLGISLSRPSLTSSPESLAIDENSFLGASSGYNVIPGTDLSCGDADGAYYYNWQLSAIARRSPTISSIQVAGSNLIISGGWGATNGLYFLLEATNLTAPWTPVATNYFDTGGNFSFTLTNRFNSTPRQAFYKLELQ